MARQSKSHLEQQFVGLWCDPRVKVAGCDEPRPEPEREYVFHPTRQWRLDFAWPDCRVGVEIHGGTYQRGRTGHTSPTGHQSDCEKANAAQLCGWILLAYTSKDLKSRPIQVLEEVLQALKERGIHERN